MVIDQMLGVRQRDELRMAPRFLAQATRRLELALTEIGKASGNLVCVRPSGDNIKSGMAIRHVM